MCAHKLNKTTSGWAAAAAGEATVSAGCGAHLPEVVPAQSKPYPNACRAEVRGEGYQPTHHSAELWPLTQEPRSLPRSPPVSTVPQAGQFAAPFWLTHCTDVSIPSGAEFNQEKVTQEPATEAAVDTDASLPLS